MVDGTPWWARPSVVVPILVLAAAAACRSSAPAQPAPAAPSGPDPAVEALTGFRERICACTDEACRQQAHRAYVDWLEVQIQHGQPIAPGAPSPGPAEQARDGQVRGLLEAIHTCREQPLHGAGDRFVDDMAGFRDRFCACTDMACANEVDNQIMAWAMEHAEQFKQVKPTPEQEQRAKQIGDEMQQCRDRLDAAAK